MAAEVHKPYMGMVKDFYDSGKEKLLVESDMDFYRLYYRVNSAITHSDREVRDAVEVRTRAGKVWLKRKDM